METKNSIKGKMFKSPILEILTKTTPLITILIYGSVMFILLVISPLRRELSLLKSIGIYLSGIFFWSFFEYVMHRFIFHFITDSQAVKRMHYLIHGVHHEYPKDEHRIFMPPVPGLIILCILFFFFYMILNKYVYLFLPGMINGYLIYSFLHYSIHKFRSPKLLKGLWKYHYLHHYKYQDKAYGVSSSLWDYIFGTLPPRKKLKS
jgi:sterol desaturase/sphingolipid hydroxylase (fatty acid hydroxylase superfamily)